MEFPPGNEKTWDPPKTGKPENHRLKSAGWDGIWDSSQEGILRMVDILVVNLPVIKLLRNRVMHFPPQVWGQFRSTVFQAAVLSRMLLKWTQEG